MNQPDPQTIEQVLFERMGVSVENALATGTDVIDEKVSVAAEAGIDVEQRFDSLCQILEKLTEPAVVTALGQLIENLPQLAQLSKLANEMPNILATLGDVVDDYQNRYAEDGIDVEKAISNGVQVALFLGSQVDGEHLRRIGDLLGSDIFNPHALNVVDNAAKSLSKAQENVCKTSAKNRVGMFGLLAALRKPEIQRSLAFALRFGECFGKNLETESKNENPPTEVIK